MQELKVGEVKAGEPYLIVRQRTSNGTARPRIDRGSVLHLERIRNRHVSHLTWFLLPRIGHTGLPNPQPSPAKLGSPQRDGL